MLELKGNSLYMDGKYIARLDCEEKFDRNTGEKMLYLDFCPRSEFDFWAKLANNFKFRAQ